jgi:hypothetical protein
VTTEDRKLTIGLRRIFDPLAPLAGLALSACPLYGNELMERMRLIEGRIRWAL